jgi:hypothetical protein
MCNADTCASWGDSSGIGNFSPGDILTSEFEEHLRCPHPAGISLFLSKTVPVLHEHLFYV